MNDEVWQGCKLGILSYFSKPVEFDGIKISAVHYRYKFV